MAVPLQKALQAKAGTAVPLDAQGAANVWAGTTGLSLVAALNVRNSSTGLGLSAVVAALNAGQSLNAETDFRHVW